MEKYELTIVMPEKATPARVKSFKESLAKLLKLLKGNIVEEKEWGKLPLAYKIKKNESGLFLYFELELEKGSTSRLNENLKSEEKILRHLLVKKEK